MMDVRCVQVEANNLKYFELVIYIEEHLKEYIRFIMFGEIDK
jgi:hypothetical protein